VGTGPWKFEKWESGQQIRFVRNDGYWDPERKPYLDRLVFRVVLDPTVAYQLMLKGELDVLTKIQARQWVQMTEDPSVIANYRRFRYFTNNYTFVAWNEKRPFFADKRVRLALAELFDQDDFDENSLYGLELRTECIFYEASSACDPGVKPVAYDVAQAKRLLAEAGWTDHDGDGIIDKDGVPFRFTLISQTNSDRIGDMAAVLQQAYQAVGIDMKYRPMEWSVMLQHLQDHDFDATSLGFGDPDVYTDPFEIWHSSQAKNGQNWVSFNDPAVDKLIEEGRREFDEGKRTTLWRALGREIHSQQPFMMLTVSPELEAVKKKFRGVKPSLTYYDFSRWWIAE
jgi:peptide/nickel transport system substrate-binding protein